MYEMRARSQVVRFSTIAFPPGNLSASSRPRYSRKQNGSTGQIARFAA